MRDLVVAGGGPVGLATALYAARAGLDVVVREPRAGLVDKACGEGLMPGAVARLGDLGVHPAGQPLTGIRYLDDRGRTAEAPFRHGTGLGVRRTTLHAALMHRVGQVGIPVDRAPVKAVVDRGTHLLVDGCPARYLVGADGLHSAVRRLVGLAGTPTRSRRYGLRRHFGVTPWSSHVEVYWSAHAEAYVTPVGPREVGVAVLSAERVPFEVLLDQFPRLLDRLGGADEAGAVRGAGPLRQRVREPVRGRVLLVGDAAGYVDALTGEGIALGVAQAEAAVRAIAADGPASYAAAFRRLGRRHELLTLGLVTATRAGPVRRVIVPAARRLPGVFGAAVDQLARPL